ncbi:hypothetical protein BBP40_012063, partial [Aspergillus hancockii]
MPPTTKTISNPGSHPQLQSHPQDQQPPPLTTTLTTTTTDQIAALHLISDSVAQQRQNASLALSRNPITLLLLLASLLCIHLNLSTATTTDWTTLLITYTTTLTIFLLTIRYLTSGYLSEAEKVGTWAWLRARNRHPDLIVVTKFGDKVIGALVLRGIYTPGELEEHAEHQSDRERARIRGLGLPVGVIRAWTV